MQVYLLWHIHHTDDGDDEKLVGVYSEEALAREAASRAGALPGFVVQPDLKAASGGGFVIDAYTLDEDEWTEGFVRVAVE